MNSEWLRPYEEVRALTHMMSERENDGGSFLDAYWVAPLK